MNKRALVVVVAALSGCSGDDSVAIDDLPDALRSAECAFEVRCELIPDQATCAAVFPLDSTEVLTTIAEVKNGRIAYDGKLAKQCVDAFLGLGCTLSEIQNTFVADACNNMFEGTIADGAACVVSTDCVDHGNCPQTDPSCDPSTACCVGSCVAVPARVVIGGACTNSNPDCVDGAFCDIPMGAQTGTCKAHVEGEGSVCDAFDACAAPRTCVVPPTMTTGTCTTLPAEGEHCDIQQSLGCGDLRDYCDQTTSLCTHHAGVGEACDGPNGASCVGFATCDTTTSKCVARPALGDACDESTGIDCLNGLQCVNLKCVGQPAGMTCAL